MKKIKQAPKHVGEKSSAGWITAEVAVHIARRRIGRLLPLRIEPGRKFVLGTKTIVRGMPFAVRGFGYESGKPTIHLEKLG